MKGIVFTEFLEMVEQEFGPVVVEEIIDSSVNLSTGGAYTSVGTYDYREMFQLVGNLSVKTGIPAPSLLEAYGKHLFQRFVKGYPSLFQSKVNLFDFLESLENHIHVEVKKLYPSAELPKFETIRVDNKKLEMVYYSQRALSDFAVGLIKGASEHFTEPVDITREDISEKKDGTVVKITIQKN